MVIVMGAPASSVNREMTVGNIVGRRISVAGRYDVASRTKKLSLGGKSNPDSSGVEKVAAVIKNTMKESVHKVEIGNTDKYDDGQSALFLKRTSRPYNTNQRNVVLDENTSCPLHELVMFTWRI